MQSSVRLMPGLEQIQLVFPFFQRPYAKQIIIGQSIAAFYRFLKFGFWSYVKNGVTILVNYFDLFRGRSKEMIDIGFCLFADGNNFIGLPAGSGKFALVNKPVYGFVKFRETE